MSTAPTPVSHRGAWWLAAAALLLVLAMAAPVLQGRFYTSFDFEQFFIPSRAFYSLCLDQGELGLWNPYQCRGFEHHAEGQTGVFSPWHWALYRWLPFPVGFGLELFLYFPLAIGGAWLLLRREWRLSPTAAAFGGCLFGLSTMFYAHFGHLHNQWQMAHLPWLAWLVCRCFRPGSAAFSAGALGLGYASVILLGHPQFTWLISLLLGLLLLYRLWTAESRRQAAAGAAFAVAGLAAGLLIGLLQLIPTLEALRQVSRGNLNPLERLNYSLHPLNLLQNLSPLTFAGRTVGDTFFHSAAESLYLNNPSEFTAYAGVTLLTLLAAGLVICRRRLGRPQRWTLGLGLAVFGLLTLGKYGLLHSLLGKLPLVAEIRAPARYFVIVLALLVLLGALVIHALDTDPPAPLDGRQWRLLFIVPALSLAGCLVLLAIGTFQFRGATVRPSGLLILTGPLLAAAVAVAVGLRCRGRRWALPVIGLLCLADAAIYGLPLVLDQPTRPAGEVAAVPERLRHQDHTFRRIAETTRPLWDGWYLANGYMAILPAEKLRLASLSHLRVAAVSHGLAGGEWRAVPAPLPRFRLVPELRFSDDPLAELDSTDPRQTALIRPGSHPRLAALHGPPLEPADSIVVEEDGFDRLRLTVTCRQPRLLAIADRWAPGWQVASPGYAPDALLPLYDGAVRGLVVDPAFPEVMLVYWPKSFLTGLRFARLGLLLAAGLLAAGLFSHFRASRRPDCAACQCPPPG